MRKLCYAVVLFLTVSPTFAASNEWSVTYCAEKYTPAEYKNWEQLRAQCYAKQKRQIEKTQTLRDIEAAKGNDKNWCLVTYKTFEEQQYCLRYK